MSEIANLVENHLNKPAAKLEASTGTKQLFMLLHGAYGSLFLSKFSTGEKDAAGKDKGIKSAMLVWDSALRDFSADVIEIAAARMRREFPEFPPSLPQFEAICKATMPRQTFAQEAGLKALPAPQTVCIGPVNYQVKSDGKDWARKILARQEAGDRVLPCAVTCARAALMTDGERAGLPA